MSLPKQKNNQKNSNTKQSKIINIKTTDRIEATQDNLDLKKNIAENKLSTPTGDINDKMIELNNSFNDFGPDNNMTETSKQGNNKKLLEIDALKLFGGECLPEVRKLFLFLIV